jgi:hypothetical protein
MQRGSLHAVAIKFWHPAPLAHSWLAKCSPFFAGATRMRRL